VTCFPIRTVHERILIMPLDDRIVEDRRGTLVLSTDRSRIDRDTVLALLLESHWGGGMTMPVLDRAIANSVNFSVLDEAGRQVGFARVVSDLATYAYLTDVIVAEAARGQGIGSWMVEAILAHPDLQGLRRVALFTRNARALYERYGFSTDRPASVYMELRPR
jgi:ribosomal protein S18 acetylase RimI-like enzyme